MFEITDVHAFWKDNPEYVLVIRVPIVGVCAVEQMIGFVALWYGCDRIGKKGRYSFGTLHEALYSLSCWDGVGDPPGCWLTHKGQHGEYDNPIQQ